MARRVMDEALKAKMAKGRADAREMRQKAPQLLEEYGALLLSWKFWRNLSMEDRNAISAAIRKADIACLNADIKSIKAELEAKQAEKESLSAR